MISIAVAEDNFYLAKAIREKLALHNEFKLKFLAENGEVFLERLQEDTNVQLVLMDIEMPIKNGIDTTAEIKNRFPQIKVIMLTVFDDDENIFNAIKAGADGYLLKEISAIDLRKSIIETLEGGASMSPSIALKTLKLLRNPPDFTQNESSVDYQLTEREIEVLEQLSKGLNYQRIAENLFLSPYTVRKHIENIYSKLQVHSKLEAVDKAKKERLI